MNTEILGVAVQIVLMVVLAYPLGRLGWTSWRL